MNQYEIPAMLEDELPAIAPDLKENAIKGNVTNAIKVLTNYTRKLVSLHDLPAVVKCMQVADKIYEKGNNVVRNAVENVFVYSFSGLQCACNKLEWKVIQAKMPLSLYSAYVRQIYKSGI
jgi:hypothetical protein